MRTWVTSFPPTSWVASALSILALEMVNRPKIPWTVWVDTLNRWPTGVSPAATPMVTGTPSVVASNVWVQPQSVPASTRPAASRPGFTAPP